jgi:hypothetical protein
MFKGTYVVILVQLWVCTPPCNVNTAKEYRINRHFLWVNYGLAKRYLPDGTVFQVKYDDEAPRREEGGKETLIHIIWEE